MWQIFLARCQLEKAFENPYLINIFCFEIYEKISELVKACETIVHQKYAFYEEALFVEIVLLGIVTKQKTSTLDILDMSRYFQNTFFVFEN